MVTAIAKFEKGCCSLVSRTFGQLYLPSPTDKGLSLSFALRAASGPRCTSLLAVEGSGFKVSGLGLGAWGLGFGVWGLGLRV
eukprot:10065134-Karenia_brevis.AAC.1